MDSPEEVAQETFKKDEKIPETVGETMVLSDGSSDDIQAISVICKDTPIVLQDNDKSNEAETSVTLTKNDNRTKSKTK